MKIKHLTHFSALLALPFLAATAFAEDKDKDKPRPAQESRGGTTTGKDATQPPAENRKDAPRPAKATDPAKTTEAAKTTEPDKANPRPAQESRGGTTTGRDATKTPNVAPSKDKAKDAKTDKEKDADKKK